MRKRQSTILDAFKKRNNNLVPPTSTNSRAVVSIPKLEESKSIREIAVSVKIKLKLTVCSLIAGRRNKILEPDALPRRKFDEVLIFPDVTMAKSNHVTLPVLPTENQLLVMQRKRAQIPSERIDFNYLVNGM